MASTYTDAGIELIGIGEQSNTWGQTTNTNWRLMEEMVAGVVSINLTGLTSSNLTVTDGVTSNGRHMIVEFTGAPGAAATVTVNPDDMQKLYFITNATDQSVTITQGSGGDVTVPAGTKKIVYCDGAGGGAAVTDLTENLSLSGQVDITTLKLDGVEITASASELNTLDGVTATTTELNVLDGITASTVELNILDGVTASANEINLLDGVTASTSELNTLSGVTASTAELNIMDGVTASTAEINHIDGVTSSVQTQLDNKAEESTTISAGTGLSGGGSLAANRTISHADTSSQGSVDNSGNTFVQSVTLDGFGHITSVESQTVATYQDSDSLTLFNATGAAPVFACRAWVNFDGRSSISIRGSGNVSSVTDLGTGFYQVNFTTDIEDSNYSAVVAARSNDLSQEVTQCSLQEPQATSSFRIQVAKSGGNVTDGIIVCGAVFR